jgi:2-polyprenyl-3-methyl-5-hydroxy-6-metoxy-1,4-benzoquinol methylase
MMNYQHTSKNETQSRESDNALTKQHDWVKYYECRKVEKLDKSAHEKSFIDDYLTGKTGKIFELGCGGSSILARSALLGWDVGGIDFNKEGLNLIENYLSQKSYDHSNLVCGDVFSYDCSRLENKYDLLVSFGFLEHFKTPQIIINRWKKILKNDGMVISMIPNLFNINKYFLKKYPPELWAQHVLYSPQDMDRFHIDAGLKPIKKARYCERYDIHMLTPWNIIEQKIGNKFIFKGIKYFSYYVIGKILGLAPKKNVRLLNSCVTGVYAN